MNQYSNHTGQSRKRRGSGYRYDSGRNEFLHVLLFYVLPFVAVNAIIFILVTAAPKGKVTIGETSDFLTTAIELKVNSLLPIREPILNLDGSPVAITKIGSKTYTATLKTNGVLEVDLQSVNGMKNVFFEQVNILDDTPPTVEDTSIQGGILTLHLEDSQSGVDYSTVYATDDDGPQILPLSVDPVTGTVTFPMNKENLTICAQDKTGNEVRVTITPDGENLDPDEETGDASDTEADGAANEDR